MGKEKFDDNLTTNETGPVDNLEKSTMVISADIPSTSVDECDIWLVRKPIKVPLSDISSIKFPRKAKSRFKIVTPSRPSSVPLNCYFSRLVMPHVFIPTANIKKPKDAMKLKAASIVKGVVIVSTKLDSINGVIKCSNAEGNEQPSSALEHRIHETNFAISSLRKKPQLPTGDMKQRLKPFGIIPKKKKRSHKLPNIIGF